MHKVRCFFLIWLLLLLLAGAVLFGCFVPIRVETSLSGNGSAYMGDNLDVSDVQVTTVSLFGLSRVAENASVRVMGDDSTFRVKAAGMTAYVPVSSIAVAKLDAQYSDPLLVGDRPKKSALTLTATFEDGTVRNVPSFTMDNAACPFVEEYYIKVSSIWGETSAKVTPVQPSSLTAEYTGPMVAGEPFDKSRVTVVVSFDGGEQRLLRTFEIKDMPEYFTGPQQLQCVTAYGDTNFDVDPIEVKSLSAEYTAPIYEGDEINRDAITMITTLGDDTSHPVEDFHLPDIGYLHTNTRVNLESRYGTAHISLEPVIVKKAVGTLTEDTVAGGMPTLESVKLVYTDGTERDLDLSEVTVTNASQTMTDGDNKIWFRWHGGWYHFGADVIPTEVAQLRNAPNGFRGTTYADLSYDQLHLIALICQRVAGNDVMIASYEASLLANRYELYGGGMPGSGYDLVEFLKNSGYWGQDVERYTSGYSVGEDIEYVVEDVLLRGYRSLPAYVDERSSAADVVSVSSGTYVPDRTDVTLSGGKQFRYFLEVRSGSMTLLYGYTASAYQSITGYAPLAAVVQQQTEDISVSTMDDDIIFLD